MKHLTKISLYLKQNFELKEGNREKDINPELLKLFYAESLEFKLANCGGSWKSMTIDSHDPLSSQYNFSQASKCHCHISKQKCTPTSSTSKANG